MKFAFILNCFGSVRLPLLLVLPSALTGQDVLGELPSLPTGFGESFFPTESQTDQDLSFTVRFNALYDSNVRQGSGRNGRPIESDLQITPGLGASYLRRKDLWQLGANANLNQAYFLESDNLDRTNYSAGLFGGYQSTKLVASFTSNLSSAGGVNRISGTFLEQFSYSTGLMASYRLSGKTSFLLAWNQQNTTSETDGFGDTSSSTASLSAIWRATPLINVGPGFRYGVRTGRSDEELIVLGPTLRFDYQLSTRVKLRSSIGLDYRESPFGEDTRGLNYSLSLGYKRSSLWGLDLSMIQDTEASFLSGGGFDETSSFRLAYWRQIRRAKLQLSLSLQDRDARDLGTINAGLRDPTMTNAGIGDSSFLNYGASVSMPVLRDQASLSLNVSWRDISAENEDFSSDGFQAGLGLSWQF